MIFFQSIMLIFVIVSGDSNDLDQFIGTWHCGDSKVKGVDSIFLTFKSERHLTLKVRPQDTKKEYLSSATYDIKGNLLVISPLEKNLPVVKYFWKLHKGKLILESLVENKRVVSVFKKIL